MKNKLTYKLVLLILLSIPLVLEAQNNNIKTENISSGLVIDKTAKGKRIGLALKNNLSIHLGSYTPWIGLSYERLINPSWGFDISVGLIGASIGTKVYFPKLSKGKISFYSGISEGVLLLVGSKHYIPIGFTYIGNKRFRLSFDLGPQIYYDKDEENQIGINLKLGKSF